MQLAQQLKAAGVNAFPCVVHYDAAKHKWQKKPITVNREAWTDTAARAIDDPAVQWSGCTVLGVPIPAGVVIIDLDTYKDGVTTATADAILGTQLPWAQALIQTTISGGQHYAFRLPAWTVKQGSNLGGPGSGIDTRVAGLGFICSGGGYAPDPSGFGVMRLAYPESLPMLPDTCRAVLENVAPEAPAAPVELPDSDERDVASVQAALAHIDPSERDDWRAIGFALKHYFHDDEAAGFDLWDRWSAGEYWADGCPATYAQDTQPGQWGSFKAVKEGASITIGTLFHMAVRGGWQPPARFDSAMAFGAGAAPADTFSALVDRIMEEGTDSRKTEEILQAITSSGCNEVQAILLRNELKAVMKSAKLLDKDLAAVIDRATTPTAAPVGVGLYGKNHTENAQLFLQANYPADTLVRSDEIWYAYTGKCWAELEDAEVDHHVTMAMLHSLPQRSTVSGTCGMLSSMSHRSGVSMTESPAGVVVFQNGVLNLHTGVLAAHDKSYLTTKIVPYNFDPNATAPRWLSFINETLESDQERIALLQEWLGYQLSPSYEHQKVMLLLGPKRCGKSTIGSIIAELVGELNYTGCSLSSFADDDYLDSLRNKTVAFSGDTQKNISRSIIDAVIERVKKISGNDSVDFKRKYKSRMTCKLPTRITLAANNVPRLFDDSEALATRLLVLPFDVSFLNREDPALLQALLGEIEGIALWSLQGLARLNANKRFTVPAASKGEMQFITEMYSPMRMYIDACCTLGTDDVITCADLYENYRAWALNTGEDSILPRKTFISAFKDAARGHGCRYGVQAAAEYQRGFKGVTVGTVAVSPTAAAFTPSIVK